MPLRSVTLTTAPIAWAVLTAALALGGCNSSKPPPPPDTSADELRAKTAELAKAGEQIQALQKEIDSARKAVATAGAGVHGVQIAADLVVDEATKKAVKSEADLAKKTLDTVAPADPAAVAAAELRVSRVADQEIDKLKAQLAANAEELKQAKAKLDEQSATIASQGTELTARAKQASDQDAALKARAQEVDRWSQKYDSELKVRGLVEQQRESARAAAADGAMAARSWWGIVVAGAGIVVIVAGLFAFALSSGEALASATFTVFAGAAVVVWGLKFDLLLPSKAFPYVAGLATASALAALGWCLYFFWQTHQLYRKLTAALQDAKDEAVISGSDMWNELREHLKYRLGDGTSYWSTTLKRRLLSRGLRAEGPTPVVNPATANRS